MAVIVRSRGRSILGHTLQAALIIILIITVIFNIAFIVYNARRSNFEEGRGVTGIDRNEETSSKEPWMKNGDDSNSKSLESKTEHKSRKNSSKNDGKGRLMGAPIKKGAEINRKSSVKNEDVENLNGKVRESNVDVKKSQKENDKNMSIRRNDKLKAKDQIVVEARSGKDEVFVSVNGSKIFKENSKDAITRGLHIVVLSQYTGKVMTTRQFDTHYFSIFDEQIIKFVESVHSGRIVVFVVKDEASYSLGKEVRIKIGILGCPLMQQLGFRDSYVCIKVKNGGKAVEEINKGSYEKWAKNTTAKVIIPLFPKVYRCNYGSNEEAMRRSEFCFEYEGYFDVCRCTNFASIKLKGKSLPNNRIINLPVAVIAANRPLYLYRMLRKALTAQGADPKMFTVYIDGNTHKEPVAVAELFGLRVVQHEPICSKNCRISQHYKRALAKTFKSYPDAPAIVILEEDLEVSEDIFDYFSQTYPLLERDPSVYCISAWNDLGNKHAVKDPARLYRVETMPGLGWVLKRSLFIEELEPKWPDSTHYWDWDVWMRLNYIRKDRECIIPEISRTFHFGVKGLNMNGWFHQLYFAKHALNQATGITFDIEKLQRENYEKEMHYLVKNAKVLDHTKNQCTHKDAFIPNTKNKTYVAYIQMDNFAAGVDLDNDEIDNYNTWINLAGCFEVWDLGVRDLHKGALRISYKDNSVIIVGVPMSDYAIHKPRNITPISLPEKKKSH